MKPTRDPEKAELRHLTEVCPLVGKRVLEIGCGDGAFTRQYAPLARNTIGMDPIESEVNTAKSADRTTRAVFLVGQGEKLPFSQRTFDMALFASSL